MTYKTDEEVDILVKKFEERSLPKAEWTHSAHLTVGLYYLFNHPFGVAKNLMSDGIYWLNDAHGTPNTETSGYHETLTVFWLRMIAEYNERNSKNDGLAQIANGLLAEYNDTKLPLNFYTRERLFSVEARLSYIEPNLKPFTLTLDGLVFA